jgi:hypothetical protein
MLWVLICASGCLEGFGSLVTRVAYDPFAQVFRVERELLNVDRRFFDCQEAASCMTALHHMRDVVERGEPEQNPAERMVRHLLDTGATDVTYELYLEGESLNIRVAYEAPLGSRAAGDTRVHVEHQGGRYRLVVDAQASMEKLGQRHRVRRQSQVGTGPLDWREEWVLPAGVRDVTVRQKVDVVDQPVLAAVAGFKEALRTGGWLGTSRPLGATVATVARQAPQEMPGEEAAASPPPVGSPPLEPVEVHAAPLELPDPPLVAVEEVVEAPLPEVDDVLEEDEEVLEVPEGAPSVEPEPVSRPLVAEVSPTPARVGLEALPPYDRASHALVFVHPPTLEGAVEEAALGRAMAALEEHAGRCYQARQAVEESLSGHAFVDLDFTADGGVSSSAIYGNLPDPPMLRCLEVWVNQQVWAGGMVSQGPVRIRIPVTFQVQDRRRKKRGM